jgi:hypothetical protein
MQKDLEADGKISVETSKHVIPETEEGKIRQLYLCAVKQ